jgi:hypothetical protein
MQYQIQQFVDDDGRQVMLKTSVSDIMLKLDKGRYIGMFTVAIPTQFGPRDAQIQFDFPEDYKLSTCFEDFDKLAKEEYERLVAEAKKEQEKKEEENLIVTPDAGGIVIP